MIREALRQGVEIFERARSAMRMRLSGMGLAAASCLAALTFAGPASASPAPFTEAQAKKQLREVERAGSGPIRADLTLALRDLALALPKLDGAAERRARSILSRPPNDNSPSDEGGWPANANEQIVETPDFIVHYALVPGCDVAQPNPDVNCDEPDLTDARRRTTSPTTSTPPSRRSTSRSRSRTESWGGRSPRATETRASRTGARRRTASTSTSPTSATRTTAIPASSATPHRTTPRRSATARRSNAAPTSWSTTTTTSSALPAASWACA